MTKIPDVIKKQTSYENFTAWCPLCNFKNIYNRVTDLGDVRPIGHKQVNCLNPDCVQPFNISGDSINPAYQMLIYDCCELRDQKHYMYCLLNLVQAYEVFFSQYLRAELLYRPYALDSYRDLDEFNRLANLLYAKVQKHTFAKMQNLFFHQVLQQQSRNSLTFSEVKIKGLPDKPPEPSDDKINSVVPPKLSVLLMRLKKSKVAELRNRVVHKHAYRPRVNEVDDFLEETCGILFPLARMLEVSGDDLNWYITKYGKY